MGNIKTIIGIRKEKATILMDHESWIPCAGMKEKWLREFDYLLYLDYEAPEFILYRKGKVICRGDLKVSGK